MKYTRLPLSDLKDLEKEFIEFLAINGITADQWENWQTSDTEKLDAIIDQFSDVVWESILRKNDTVEKRVGNKITVCAIKNERLITLYIQCKKENYDLQKEDAIDSLLKHKEDFSFSFQEEKLNKSQSEQLFELLKVGFSLTKNKSYKNFISKFY